jgi:MoaA/NifB/PqqE/SkfB family radical SAM enzyme
MNINRKLKIFRCAFQSGTTPFASLFITRRCNCSCAFCRVPASAGIELSADQWKRAIDILCAMGVRNISFNGGEPLLREDAGEIISYASREKGCITWLFTNAMLLEEPRLKAFKDLDFLCASPPDLTGSQALPHPRFFRELKKCEKFGISPAFLATITADNVDIIYDIALLCVGNNILFDFGLIQDVGGLFSSQEGISKPDAQQLKPLFKKLGNLRAKTGKILPSYKLLRKAAEFYRKNSWKCPVKKNPYIVVDADGTLMPCQEYSSSISIFDITSLSDERWIKMKRKIIEQCPGCSWTSYYQKTFRNPFDLLQESVVLLKS